MAKNLGVGVGVTVGVDVGVGVGVSVGVDVGVGVANKLPMLSQPSDIANNNPNRTTNRV